MTIQTSPNGITTNSAEGGLQIVNLGALAGGGTTTLVRGLPGANEAAMGDIITGTQAAGLAHTVVMEAMPVGSEIEFQIAMADAATALTIQEQDAGGVARIIEFQSDAGGNVALTQSVALFPVTDSIDLAAGVLGATGLATATASLRLRKNLPSSTAIVSDGWTILSMGALNFTT
jgi:hypothetical protein